MSEARRPPLYAHVLGETWHALPQPLRQMHDVDGEGRAEGLADIDRGHGLIARLIAAVVGFPRAGQGIPVQVHFTADANGELWQRTFAGKRFASYQFAPPASVGNADEAPSESIVFERFGPITIALHLVLQRDRLNVVPMRWSLLGLPLPRTLMPIGETYEWVDTQNRFNFHVEIAHPWLGLVVRYRGFLVPS